MQDDEVDKYEGLKEAALEIYNRLTLEELQTLVALAIEVLCDHEGGIDDMLEMISDGHWDQFFDCVKMEPRGGN